MGEPNRGSGRGWVREASELIGSMRFAIALLGVICIASVIGTVVKQGEPASNYVNQFGPFWAQVFDQAGLYAVYSAGWFLLILAFLVVSTSLCIARNAPKIVADWRTFKEGIRASALEAFHHKAGGTFPGDAAAARAHVEATLQQAGWSLKADARGDGTMIAARRGMASRIGYLAAHSAIVLICLGGLSDGDLIVRLQMLMRGVTPVQGAMRMADIGPEHRLPDSNPTFRGNLAVAEGERAGLALLQMPQGVVLQALPFDVELKRFVVEYYDTGMPKLFASDIVVHDRIDGSATPARVEVNKPVTHRGVTIYQSSFDDGGSQVTLKAWPLRGTAAPGMVNGRIGERLPGRDGQPTLELAALRTINVENLGAAAPAGAASADVRGVDLIGQHLGSGARSTNDRKLHNVGPSITYRLRDASGQAREFHAYMRPMELDGQRVLLAGVRTQPDQPFQYLRIPADEKDSVEGWWHVWRALHDPAMRAKAVERYVAQATPGGAQAQPQSAGALRATAERALAMFAGVAGAMPAPASSAASAASAPAPEGPVAGLAALSMFVERSVPQPERERMAEVLLRIVGGTLFELVNVSREAAGQPALAPGDDVRRSMSATMMALSDASFYPADVMLQLDGFEQVQASVFQVARAPGKVLVYLGAVLLILGVFAMLYIREKRLWVWLTPGADGTDWRCALSATRRTLDVDASFAQLVDQLKQRTPGATHA